VNVVLARNMSKLLKNRISKKEEELKAVKAKLKSKKIQARCMALMKLQPLKNEIAELHIYLAKKIQNFRNKRAAS